MSHRMLHLLAGRLATKPIGALVGAGMCLFLLPAFVYGQPGKTLRATNQATMDSPAARAKAESYIQDVLLPEVTLQVDPRQSKLIRTRKPVSRFSITNPENLEVVQFSPTEFELIGLKMGQTTLTLWFGDLEVLRYMVKVSRDTDIGDRRKSEYGDLQDMVNEMFPNSSIQLIPIADKLIVRGQARDAEEAAHILSLISGEAVSQSGGLVFGNIVSAGTAAVPYPGQSDLPSSRIINLLDVPGEQQVMLKVRVAELSRSALRSMGFEINGKVGSFSWSSLLGTGGAFSAILDTKDVDLALTAIASNGYSKILAEPNLVTLSGRQATFMAGGEFAVPVVVGVEGAAAATTNFRGFGTMLTFLPTVIDKDRIRLQVTPTVSGLSASTPSVDGIPGLDTRSVNTTVDLREGQWLAIAGLIQDEQTGSKVRVPGLGDIPILDTLFSRKSMARDERELIILVSPELVHPMEAEEAPLILPGMDVTEPGDWQFYFYGNYEGNKQCDHRSTVYNLQFRRALTAKHQANYRASQDYFISGAHGFSN
jgi:pilus assembly protein CpaC